MKLIIKTIKNETFPIEIDPESTVMDLKKVIQKEKSLEIESQNLIFKGLLLVDTKTLKECKIEEGAMIVVMMKKNLNIAQQPQQQPAAAQPAINQQQQQALVQPIAQPVQQPKHPQEKIDQLMQMGFLQIDVIAALDAANGDPIIAAEYLLGGMEGLQEEEQMGQAGNAGVGLPQQLQALIQQNPQMIQQLLQQNPQLQQQLEQNPQLLQNLLQMQNEGDDDEEDEEDEEGYDQSALNQNIDTNLSEQDEQAIQRIMALGFEREVVVQAYLQCMKNEDITANYLFDSQFGN